MFSLATPFCLANNQAPIVALSVSRWLLAPPLVRP
jgi:hypothetical protein